MFFILSKVLVFLLLPLSWIVVLLLVALITKKTKRKRRCFIAGVLLLLIFTNPFFFNQFARCWDIPSYPLKAVRPYSCAIVLGGFISQDGKGNGFFNAAADRFIQGIRLLSTGKVTHLLTTGGNASLKPNQFSEGDWVKTQLKELKFPNSCILIENRSRNTIENARYSKAILQSAHLSPPYILVTSAFHMRRSLMIFKKTGLDVVPYSCNYITGAGPATWNDLIPDADILARWNIYLKEVVGFVVNWFKN